MVTTTSAPIVGPLLGGYIGDNWWWTWIFFINLPVIAIVFFVVRSMVTPFETPVVRKPIDCIGVALLVVTVGAFQIMLGTGRENDWFASTWIITLAIIAAIGLVAFLIWELTEDRPIVEGRVFRHRGFIFATAASRWGSARISRRSY